MQQQKNSNLQYSPEVLLGRDRQIIQIEDTLAFRRNKQRAEADSRQSKIQSILTSVIGDHQIGSKLEQAQYLKDPGSNYLSEIDRVSTGNINLVKLRWHKSFEIRQSSSDTHYLIYLVLAGSLSQKIGDSDAVKKGQLHQEQPKFWGSPEIATMIDLQTGFANDLGQKVESSFSEQGEVLLISIDRDSIDSALSKLIDSPKERLRQRTSKQPVKFSPSIDLTSEFGLSLKSFAQFLWETAPKQKTTAVKVAATHQPDFAPLVLQKLEQAFLACLIEGLPNNYSEEILYQTNGAFARHVHKAQTFIESHLHEEIKLGDIANATGVCSRLLQKAFADHCGCSPMRFVTLARLHQVRQELTQASTNTKIVDVMMQYQFTQGGKFAKEYHQLFGEKPSETLKKSGQFVGGKPAPLEHRPKSQLWHQLDDTTADRVGGGLVNVKQISSTLPSSSGLLAKLQHLFVGKVF